MTINVNSTTVSVLYSRASVGINSPLVRVETHVSHGMPGFTIVGLPETVVKESKERVRSAIINSGLQFTNKKIIINLSPADLPKEGGRFDLPIALGILAATGQLNTNKLEDFEFAGELALTGELRPITGIIPLAIATKQTGRSLIIPQDNFFQVSMIDDFTVYPACNLLEVCNHLSNIKSINITTKLLLNNDKLINQQPELNNFVHNTNNINSHFHNLNNNQLNNNYNNIDLADISGQFNAKRALEITAAGGHNLLMVGPPGTGKTMLAIRLATIMPQISIEQSLEIAAIYSLKGLDREILTNNRPFRNPHHTISSAALVGGGSTPKPGEISLAHHGILFLDELPEFNRSVLEVLREPMESSKIIISRAKQQIEFPAKFQLVAAMNPCPCGNYGNTNIKCTCSNQQIKRYLAKISGPLLDRIDICIEVPNVTLEDLTHLNNSYPETEIEFENFPNIRKTTSLEIKEKVEKAYQIQVKRQNNLNASLNNKMLQRYCKLDEGSNNFIYLAVKKLKLSVRSYCRILKVARTIADLAEQQHIKIEHLQEAVALNKLPILE